MNKKVELLVKGNIDRFIKKCIDNHILLFDITYVEKNIIIVQCLYSDINLIKRLNYYCDISFNRYMDIFNILYIIKSNYLIFIVGFLSFILINIMSMFIINIEIIHKSSSLSSLVENELFNNGIKVLTIRKSFNELGIISKKIVFDNSNKIEWLSIKRVGMKYVVNIQEKIINDGKTLNKCKSIVSKYDSLITRTLISTGNVLIRSGDYVKKGDTLVDGNIVFNDNIKGCVSSLGEIYGNVWLNVNINIPVNNEAKVYTGSSRKNYSFNNHFLFKDKYLLFDKEIVKSYNIFGFDFKILLEKEYNFVAKKVSDGEIFDMLKEEIDNKYGNAVIVDKKVLNKVQNNDTINYRIFVVVNIPIGVYVEINGDD